GEASAVSAVNQVCGDGTTSGCEQVARSHWSSLGGVPLAAIGLVFSLVLASAMALALFAGPEGQQAIASVAFVLLGAALGVDLVLASVQAFSVKAFCALCVGTYVLNAAIFALLWPARTALRGASSVLGLRENRAVAAGLVLAALAFTLAVACLNVALIAREVMRSMTLLGSPAASTTTWAGSAPVAGGTGAAPVGDDADHWRAEAKRLQATLDDPQKVEQYYTEKAAKEYSEAKVETLDFADAATKGPTNAPVKVVEYSDFLCPFCRELARGLHNFLPQTGDRIQLVYKNYPLEMTCNPKLQRTVHNGACNLALGAICAQDQGKFWAYHDRAFAGAGESPKAEDVVRIAGEAGLDGAALGTCMAAPRTKERLTAQIEEARRLGVQSTPTLYINGKKLPRINDFVQIVDKEAQAKGFPPLPTGPPAH
ncbi:MAG TPA: thioredoxin domain-containing protein, partial [Vicinamibacteria bacterium]|nr:thioredoxin domain-containing protein [Vicinamibacteria bacterium]